MNYSHIINELAEERHLYERAVVPPIYQTSNFAFPDVQSFRQSLANEYSTFLYSRGLNPTLDILRKKLAALDGAEDALVFNSGASAIFAAIFSQVKSGDHIICVREAYGRAKKTLQDLLPKFNISHTYVDASVVQNIQDHILPNTKVIYLESPNSFLYEIQDLQAIASLAKQHNIITICDNSYCTPLYQQPIALGIDLVLQSATKYLNGHSDVLAGVLAGSKRLIHQIFENEYTTIGVGTTPFNAWLILRGLRTLPLRLERSSQTAQIVINFLKTHPQIEKIIYPLDPSFPQYNLAKKQMKGAGGLLSFVLKTHSLQQIEHFCQSLKVILMAVSWGGYESLIMPRCVALHQDRFNPQDPTHRLVRLYVGLEDPQLLIQDLQQALDTI